MESHRCRIAERNGGRLGTKRRGQRRAQQRGKPRDIRVYRHASSFVRWRNQRPPQGALPLLLCLWAPKNVHHRFLATCHIQDNASKGIPPSPAICTYRYTRSKCSSLRNDVSYYRDYFECKSLAKTWIRWYVDRISLGTVRYESDVIYLTINHRQKGIFDGMVERWNTSSFRLLEHGRTSVVRRLSKPYTRTYTWNTNIMRVRL